MKYIFSILLLFLFISCEAQMIVTPTTKNLNTDFVAVIIGDSNANGGDASSPPATIAANTLYNWNDTTLVYDQVISQSVANAFPALGSIWQYYGTAYKAAYGRPAYIVNTAKGGTYYTNSVAANSWGDVGNLRGLAVIKIAHALQFSNKSKPDIIFVNLGINDVRNGFSVPTILAAITNFYTWITTTYPGVPVVIIQQGRSEVASNSSELYQLRRALVGAAVSFTDVSIGAAGMPLVFTSGYAADNLHYNSTGQSVIGNQLVQWQLNGAYSKWGRSVISALSAPPTSAHKTLIDNFISSQVTRGNYTKFEGLFCFKAGTVNDILLDWSFIGYGANAGTFTANDALAFNGTTEFFATGIINGFYVGTSSATSAISGVRVKTNSSTGVTGLFGATDNSPNTSFSVVTNGVRFRANDATLTAGTDTNIAASTLYAVRRNGTTKELMKNKVSNASATQANTGLNGDFTMVVGAINSNTGVGSFWQGSAYYFFYSGYSGFDYDGFYDDFETLLAAW